MNEFSLHVGIMAQYYRCFRVPINQYEMKQDVSLQNQFPPMQRPLHLFMIKKYLSGSAIEQD